MFLYKKPTPVKGNLPTPNPDRGGGVGYICPLIFLPFLAKNAYFLSLRDRKPGTFLTPKRLKPLSVNQHALPNATTQAPIRVTKSTIASTPNFLAKTNASAKVKRPSAPVVLI